MKLTRSEPRPTRRLRGSLDGPSRTITVEPVERRRRRRCRRPRSGPSASPTGRPSRRGRPRPRADRARAMQASAPDLIRAVIGFRQWRLHGEELWSLHADDRWGRGLQTARCLNEAGHDGPAPQNGCTCGFYAWYAPSPRTASAATSDLVGGCRRALGPGRAARPRDPGAARDDRRAGAADVVGVQAPAPGGGGRRARGARRARTQAPGHRARAWRRHPAQHAPARHDAQQARRAGPPTRPPAVADGLRRAGALPPTACPPP